MAHHEVLRGLGAQRVHPLPRLQGRRHQGVLPQLQRGVLQRLRPLERRPRPPAPGLGHLRLEDHVRRHRHPVDHRRPPARGRAARRRRRALPCELRRRPDRRAARRDDRTAVRGDKTALFLSVRPQFSAHVVDVARRRDGALDRRDPGGERLDQRRLLRLQARDLRLRERGRGARRGSVPPPDRAGRAHRLPVRRFLRPDGHDEGQAAAGRTRGQRPRSVAERRPRAFRSSPDAPRSALGRRRAGPPCPRAGGARGRHRDRLRSDAPRAASARPSWRSPGSSSRPTPSARRRRARAPSASSRAPRLAWSRSAGSGTAISRTRATR